MQDKNHISQYFCKVITPSEMRLFVGNYIFLCVSQIARQVYFFWILQSKRKGRADYLRNINIIPKKDGTL